MVGFSSDTLFPVRKWEAVTEVETERMIHYPTGRITQGAGIVKGWENKEAHDRIPDTFTCNQNGMITRPTDAHSPLYDMIKISNSV